MFRSPLPKPTDIRRKSIPPLIYTNRTRDSIESCQDKLKLLDKIPSPRAVPKPRVSSPRVRGSLRGLSKDDLDLHMGSASELDLGRTEMAWSEKQEDLILRISDECLSDAYKHNKQARYYKKMYNVLSLPAVILPLLLSTLEKTELAVHNPMVISAGLTLVAILNGISQYVNAGSRSNEHFSTENLYSHLSNDILVMLSKPRRCRVACDVVLERVRLQFQSIQSHAPDIDDPICRCLRR